MPHAFRINLLNHLTGKRRVLDNFEQTFPVKRILKFISSKKCELNVVIQFLDNIIVDLLDEMMPSKYKPPF